MPRRKVKEEGEEGPRRGTKRPRFDPGATAYEASDSSASASSSAAVAGKDEVWSSAIKALPSRDLLILVLSYNEETRIDEWELIECDLRGGDIRRAVVRQPQFQFTRDQFTGLDLMRLFSTVCGRGHLQSAMWIHSTFTLTADDFKAAQVEARHTNPFVFACSGGHLALATWLYDTFPSVLQEGRDNLISNAFLASCFGGHLSIAQWLHSTFRLTDVEANFLDGHAFCGACRRDHLAVAKWIHATFPQILSETVVGAALEAACEDGNLETAHWLVDTFPLVARGRAGWDAFRVACHRGHLDVAQWLNGIFAFHTNQEMRVDDNDQLLQLVCENGHVRVARWLHHATFAFSNVGVAATFLLMRYSVRHLPVLQWLHEAFPDVRKADLKVNSMFRSACACFSGDLSMVQWLQSTFQLTAADVGLEDNITSLTRLCCGDRILGRWLHDVFHLLTTI